jgi:hypothetical protein
MNGKNYEGCALGPFEDITWYSPGSTEGSAENFSEDI